MLQFKITDSEFQLFKAFIYDYAGINLSEEKKALVTSCLSSGRTKTIKLTVPPLNYLNIF
ncbi:MAG: hypothetical protein ACJAZ6_002365 [Oleispira sp.]|jgi:hypothetical protein